jgi:hypothetical protein
MNRIALIATACLVPVGCTPAQDGAPRIYDGSLIGTVSELADPGATYRARRAADEAKCRDLGFKPGTEAFSNCRLQLEQIRAIKQATP